MKAIEVGRRDKPIWLEELWEIRIHYWQVKGKEKAKKAHGIT